MILLPTVSEKLKPHLVLLCIYFLVIISAEDQRSDKLTFAHTASLGCQTFLTARHIYLYKCFSDLTDVHSVSSFDHQSYLTATPKYPISGSKIYSRCLSNKSTPPEMTKGKKKSTLPVTVSQMILEAQRSSYAGMPKKEVTISLGPPPAPNRPSNSNPDNLRLHPLWNHVNSLNNNLHIFLSHEYEISKTKIHKDQIYRILLHFNPKTLHRVTHLRDKLVNAFETELLPHLRPFISPPPPTPIETDLGDFDPLTAPQRVLKEAIQRKKPGLTIPAGVNSHSLHLLYKAYIDPDLVVPEAKEFAHRPRHLDIGGIKSKTIEQLRFSLQCHAPQVFIHLTPFNRTVCVDLYIKFVIEEDVEPGRLIPGFHYTIIPSK
ncbi:uncharacterized protein MELLADRAFT_65217 [Melampsora larici-populina 98AG31]|uniref:Secreted protein n=1 Tax=Melampsora larici-populina (strain 98AG31 / pathotype 3-4-7) TaxID=747676 RepID=F4RUF4_MELLP|nr:uncharacterized protein MELLADRAFT_65217 [Melampsora larici-populina 98AG31]EGG04008.1 hypothetical protein MELLADRAFT_65217 [Melampsora larici-populina 98AG31]